jgi:NADPH2:quinone reductase
MGSGIGSVSREALAQSIAHTFAAVQPANLTIATRVVPLSAVESNWNNQPARPRIVFSIP